MTLDSLSNFKLQMNKIEQLQTMLMESPDDNFLNYALALENVKAKNYDQAISIFEKLTISASNYLATYLHYGNLLVDINQPEKAAVIYQKGIKVASNQKNIKARQELEQALFLID